MFGIRTDSGSISTDPFGNIQDATVDFSFEMKELFGQYQFPIDIARAKGKINGKAKIAHINAKLYNDLFFGQAIATGETIVQANESHAIPTTPYQVTIAPPASGVFAQDQGVLYGATGIPLQKVASGPATGQYSVAAAVYTFAAADTTLVVYISYTYTIATGNTITITNQVMGSSPIFQLTWGIQYENKNFFMRLNQCIAPKMNFNAKLDDYVVPEMDFSAFADASGNIGLISLAE